MCNTCGCKAAEDSSSKKKYRGPSKKQVQRENEAMMDVDYMRESYRAEFEAMQRFPPGEHDVNTCRAELESRYPGIEITDVVYLTNTSGTHNKFHVFMETDRGNFNLYGRIGYQEPKVYGPMGMGQYNSKMRKKIRGGYNKTEYKDAEGVSHDYTPETYDPLSESPESYDPMSESFSAESRFDKLAHKIAKEYMKDGYSREEAERIGQATAYDIGVDKYGEEDMEEAAKEGVPAHTLEAHGKSHGKRKRRYGKRQRFDNIKGNSRYLARDAKGRWISNVGVSGSIKQDLRSNAHSKQPVGFRGLGDAKDAEGVLLSNAIVQWEDGMGESSPSAPPLDIMWAEEGAGMPGAIDDGYYPNSYGEDSSTFGNGVPQWYGSAEGIAYMHEEAIPNSYGGDSALTSGRGVPQWYGSAEHDQGYDDRDDEALGMRHRGHHHQSLKDRRDESKGMTDALNPHHPYSDVSTMSAEGGREKATKEVMAHYGDEGWEDDEYEEVIERRLDGYCIECSEPFHDSCGMVSRDAGCSCCDNTRDSLNEFEAMQVFPPSQQDVETAKSLLRARYSDIRFRGDPIYIIDQRGSSNKFHVFLDSNRGKFNVYGRIGYTKPTIYGPMSEGQYYDKMRNKMRKGYKKMSFDAEVITDFYPQNSAEINGVTGTGVPVALGSGSSQYVAPPVGWEAEMVELEKPIETGARLGVGFMLVSAGMIVASTLVGMIFD